MLRRFLATYRYRSADDQGLTNQHEVKLEVYLIKNLLIETKYGNQDIGNVDLLWIYRF